MKNITKKIIKFIGIYIFFFFIVYFILQPVGSNFDQMWSYGFAYSIAKGEIPYIDFTMVIPPLFPLIMSIGLKLISTNYIVYLMEETLILTITVLVLEKMYSNRAWLFLLLFIFPLFTSITITYNYFLFFLTILIVYLEKNKSINNRDYYIGFLIGLMILTKHTVGVFFIIPSIIFYLKNKSVIFKRFIGLFIPCIIFLIYLLISKSLLSFIDICVLGLFDFSKSNTRIFDFYFIMSIICLFINIVLCIKNRKNIVVYYSLCGFLVLPPIFNNYHFYVYSLFIFLSIIDVLKKDITNLNKFIVIIISTCYLGFVFFNSIINKSIYTNFITNFNYSYLIMDKSHYNCVNNLYNKYKNMGDTYFLSSKSTYISIVYNEQTNFFTVLNKGNYGYNGTKKMIDRVDKMKHTYFVIDMYEYEYVLTHSHNQFDYDIIRYIIKNSKLVEKKNSYYSVYYKE